LLPRLKASPPCQHLHVLGSLEQVGIMLRDFSCFQSLSVVVICITSSSKAEVKLVKCWSGVWLWGMGMFQQDLSARRCQHRQLKGWYNALFTRCKIRVCMCMYSFGSKFPTDIFIYHVKIVPLNANELLLPA